MDRGEHATFAEQHPVEEDQREDQDRRDDEDLRRPIADLDRRLGDRRRCRRRCDAATSPTRQARRGGLGSGGTCARGRGGNRRFGDSALHIGLAGLGDGRVGVVTLQLQLGLLVDRGDGFVLDRDDVLVLVAHLVGRGRFGLRARDLGL